MELIPSATSWPAFAPTWRRNASLPVAACFDSTISSDVTVMTSPAFNLSAFLIVIVVSSPSLFFIVIVNSLFLSTASEILNEEGSSPFPNKSVIDNTLLSVFNLSNVAFVESTFACNSAFLSSVAPAAPAVWSDTAFL